jgi:DNA-binding transcriptional LysR family regulator
MITLKQVEAFYWIVHLGTFERAAIKLNTTQSAISKRMQELEAAAGLTIFDRNLRGARLTEQGEGLLAIAEDMLGLQEQVMQLSGAPNIVGRKLRIGITELAALTWLPRFVAEFRHLYPSVEIYPEVGLSRSLLDRLQEGGMDVIVIPDGLASTDIAKKPLQKVVNAWMAKPGLVDTTSGQVSLDKLAEYQILVQGRTSGSGLVLSKWLSSKGVVFPRMLTCDSVMALLGLTVAGLGVGYIPRQCFQPMVDSGRLTEIETDLPLPVTPYVAMYRDDGPSRFAEIAAECVQSVCDFTQQFQS